MSKCSKAGMLRTQSNIRLACQTDIAEPGVLSWRKGMSALGQKRTCAAHKLMSALPLKADIPGPDYWHVVTAWSAEPYQNPGLPTDPGIFLQALITDCHVVHGSANVARSSRERMLRKTPQRKLPRRHLPFARPYSQLAVQTK